MGAPLSRQPRGLQAATTLWISRPQFLNEMQPHLIGGAPGAEIKSPLVIITWLHGPLHEGSRVRTASAQSGLSNCWDSDRQQSMTSSSCAMRSSVRAVQKRTNNEVMRGATALVIGALSNAREFESTARISSRSNCAQHCLIR